MMPFLVIEKIPRKSDFSVSRKEKHTMSVYAFLTLILNTGSLSLLLRHKLMKNTRGKRRALFIGCFYCAGTDFHIDDMPNYCSIIRNICSKVVYLSKVSNERNKRDFTAISNISSLTITHHNMKLSYGRDPRNPVLGGRQRGRRKGGCQPTPGEEGGTNLNLSPRPRSTL